MKKVYSFLFVLFSLALLVNCAGKESPLTAQQIIDKSINKSGGVIIANSKINFQFRDKKYQAIRNNGKFTLSREFDSIKDILTNVSFTRFINGIETQLADSVANSYKNSVNSVHYFSVLPFGLNDGAVRKKILPSRKINNTDYYKIEVRFNEEGGGEDFNDIFIYWINKETFYVDFLAYQYFTDGGGFRFRELKEQCVINGIRFVDYTNYKPAIEISSVKEMDELFEQGKLTKVSEIILRNIQVEPMN